ncbi:MFS general substrate transporter [Aspergillus japonicus CBS 114.51]|uniref:MFS general substrate transporter n=1 Tax=Aspergillus japonicus CBS 114.51 TaxID=1448312 RepID=A0A8T8X403_ASPJA|nr:MFS general substrate transporter [Aspergillus japonicus CBS 114.51]RAH82796.1 MFS general substrate transporter [Aspergillus japonicus CBS 114.51]
MAIERGLLHLKSTYLSKPLSSNNVHYRLHHPGGRIKPIPNIGWSRRHQAQYLRVDGQILENKRDETVCRLSEAVMVSQVFEIAEAEILSGQVSPMRKAVDFSKIHPATQLRKKQIVLAGTIFAFNGSLGASLPSGASPAIAQAFQVSEDDARLVLLNSLYLVGFVVGPLFFGPLSEYLGRRPVLIATYLAFTLFTLACALAPAFEALLGFRFLCGLNASAPNAVLSGLYSDIYEDPERRGRAMAIFMFVAMAGPMAGPLVSGFTVLLSWRWVFWVALMAAGAGVPVIILLPETYLPVIILKNAMKDCSQGGDPSTSRSSGLFGQEDLQSAVSHACEKAHRCLHIPVPCCRVRHTVLVLDSFHSTMAGLYRLSTSDNGLAFIPMIFGSLLGLCLVLVYSSIHSKAIAANKSWALVEEYRRLPLACVGAVSWSSYRRLHPALPMMAGIFFGFGYFLVFAAMLNYLTDAYKEASASAQAAASATRAIMAVVLPFAATPMYTHLGIHWASSLLGFLAFALAGIPFAFIRYGSRLRQSSGLVVEEYSNRP